MLDARDAASALQIARTARPDVITVDLLMPGIDGWAFIDRLRARRRPRPHSDRGRVGRRRTPRPGERLPDDVSVVAKGEGHDRLLREISLALAGRRGATISSPRTMPICEAC